MGRRAPQLHPCDTQVADREYTLEPLVPWWADIGSCSRHNPYHLHSRSRSCPSSLGILPSHSTPPPSFHPLRWFRNFAVTLPACPAQVTPLEPLMPPVLESSDFSATPCCRDPSWGATRHSNNLCGIPPDEWTLLQSVLPQKRGTVQSHCSSQSLRKADIGPR